MHIEFRTYTFDIAHVSVINSLWIRKIFKYSTYRSFVWRSFLLQFETGRNPAGGRSNFLRFHNINFTDHPRAFCTRSYNVFVHLPRDFSARQNSETVGMRSMFADKQSWCWIQVFAWERVCACTRYFMDVMLTDLCIVACTQVTPLPRAWRERAAAARREAARLIDWIYGVYLSRTYRVVYQQWHPHPRALLSVCPPFTFPTGPFYAFLRCTFRLSPFTADKSPVNVAAPYFKTVMLRICSVCVCVCVCVCVYYIYQVCPIWAKMQSHAKKFNVGKISGIVKWWYTSKWRLLTFYNSKILVLNFFNGFAFLLRSPNWTQTDIYRHKNLGTSCDEIVKS